VAVPRIRPKNHHRLHQYSGGPTTSFLTAARRLTIDRRLPRRATAGHKRRRHAATAATGAPDAVGFLSAPRRDGPSRFRRRRGTRGPGANGAWRVGAGRAGRTGTGWKLGGRARHGARGGARVTGVKLGQRIPLLRRPRPLGLGRKGAREPRRRSRPPRPTSRCSGHSEVREPRPGPRGGLPPLLRESPHATSATRFRVGGGPPSPTTGTEVDFPSGSGPGYCTYAQPRRGRFHARQLPWGGGYRFRAGLRDTGGAKPQTVFDLVVGSRHRGGGRAREPPAGSAGADPRRDRFVPWAAMPRRGSSRHDPADRVPHPPATSTVGG